MWKLMIAVPDLDRLQALPVPIPITIVKTDYREVQGDKGGGLWIFDGSDHTTEIQREEVTLGKGDGIRHVAPSADQTGASGAWVKIKSDWYNVHVGEAGVLASKPDNSSGLLALRAFMQPDRDADWHVHLEPAHYKYVDNKWLYGIGNVTVHADGARMECVASSGITANKRPLYFPHLFYNEGGVADQTAQATEQISGSLVQDVNVGDTVITLQTPSETSGFGVGKWVLVHGFEQQPIGSWPPNLRYFHYAKVESIDAGAGTITLDRGSHHFFDSRWKDTRTGSGSNNVSYGAPRILNLERGVDKNDITKKIEIIGGSWEGPSSTGDTDLGIHLGSNIDTVLRNVRMGDYFVVTCRSHLAFDCEWRGHIEPDKIIGYCLFRDCSMGGFSGSTGVEFLELSRSRIVGGNFRFAPRRLLIEKCSIIDTDVFGGGSNAFDVQTPNNIEHIEFRDNQWRSSIYPTFGLNFGLAFPFTVDSVTGSNEIQIAASDEVNLLGRLGYGSFIVKDDGSKYGKVTDIYWDGSGKLTLGGTWPQTPVAAETWLVAQVQVVDSNDLINAEEIPLVYLYGQGKTTRNGHLYRTTLNTRNLQFHNLTSSNGYRDFRLTLGFISRIRVTVHKAYSGGDASPILRIQGRLNSSTGASDYCLIDCLTTGTRVIQEGVSIATVSASDTLSPGNLMEFIQYLRIWTNSMAAVTPDELPVVSIEIEFLRELDIGIVP